MKYVLFLLCSLFIWNGSAQVLMKVGDETVSVSEFKEQYEKGTNADYSQQSVDNFLKLYTTYRLKLADAYAQGIHEQPELIREIAIYEEKLIQNEIDREMMNDLVQEARERLKEEICASHILIDVKRNATPEDTLLAFEHAMRIRQRILTGEETMESMAKRYSADVDTKYKSGDLGCFTTLNLQSYVLENQLYSMQEGELSLPVRSSLGYHILKLVERRPSNGMVEAKQLFVRANALQTPEQNQLAEQFIFQAYQDLKGGATFVNIEQPEELEISKDDIPYFTVGSYEKVMENAIFGLQKEEYSRPVKSSIGWHIFQLIDRRPLPNFEQIESNIRDAIQEDERFFLSKVDFADRLKKKHNFEIHQDNIDLFINQAAPGIGIPNWQMASIYDLSSPFFTIGNREYLARDFVAYVFREHELENYQGFDYYYQNFESNQLLDYHKENLIDTNEDVADLLQEFRTGMILFDYQEDKIWSKNPTEQELKTYYLSTKANYQLPDEVLLTVFTITDNSFAKKVKSQLNKRGFSGWTRLKSKNKDKFEESEIQVKQNEAIINNVKLVNDEKAYAFGSENGVSKLYRFNQMIDGEYQPFEEVKTKVTQDLMQTRNEQLFLDLKEKYPVEVNQSVLRSLYR